MLINTLMDYYLSNILVKVKGFIRNKLTYLQNVTNMKLFKIFL